MGVLKAVPFLCADSLKSHNFAVCRGRQIHLQIARKDSNVRRVILPTNERGRYIGDTSQGSIRRDFGSTLTAHEDRGLFSYCVHSRKMLLRLASEHGWLEGARAVRFDRGSDGQWCSPRHNGRGLCLAPVLRAPPIRLPEPRSIRSAARYLPWQNRRAFLRTDGNRREGDRLR
jgi:hypothetical protein